MARCDGRDLIWKRKVRRRCCVVFAIELWQKSVLADNNNVGPWRVSSGTMHRMQLFKALKYTRVQDGKGFFLCSSDSSCGSLDCSNAPPRIDLHAGVRG